MESFFRLVKLKVHFRDQYNEKLNTENQIFKPQSNKKGHLIKATTPSKHIFSVPAGVINLCGKIRIRKSRHYGGQAM